MYKLLFFIIIFTLGLSCIAEAQNTSKNETTQFVLNKDSKHYTNRTAKDSVYVYKSQNKVIHKRINSNKSKLQYYNAQELTKKDNTTQASHHKLILNHKHHDSKIIPVKKDIDSLNVKEIIKVKDH